MRRCHWVRWLAALPLHAHPAASAPTLSSATQVSAAVQRLLDVLGTLGLWVDETPAAAHALRYGNPAFRTWFARMAQHAQQVGGWWVGGWAGVSRGCAQVWWAERLLARECSQHSWQRSFHAILSHASRPP